MSIKIHIYLFLTMAYMYCTKRIEIFTYYYTFVILHELAHIVVALFLKVDVREIVLLPVGVNATYSENISKCKEVIISLAGPLASFLFAVLFQNEIFKAMNIAIGIFNLIPIYPFDGGRAIKNILLIVMKKQKAIKYSKNISKIFITLLLIFMLVLISIYKNYYIVLFAFYAFYILKDELDKEQYFDYLQTK